MRCLPGCILHAGERRSGPASTPNPAGKLTCRSLGHLASSTPRPRWVAPLDGARLQALRCARGGREPRGVHRACVRQRRRGGGGLGACVCAQNLMPSWLRTLPRDGSRVSHAANHTLAAAPGGPASHQLPRRPRLMAGTSCRWHGARPGACCSLLRALRRRIGPRDSLDMPPCPPPPSRPGKRALLTAAMRLMAALDDQLPSRPRPLVRGWQAGLRAPGLRDATLAHPPFAAGKEG